MSIKLYEGDDGRVLVMVGMTSVLLAAATWLLVASKFGLPVSTTHSAVGGVIAFAVISKGYDSVKWEKVGMIIASWFISPVMSAIMSFILYTVIDRAVLRHTDSLRRAKVAAPIFVFLVTLVVALFTVYKGLEYCSWEPPCPDNWCPFLVPRAIRSHSAFLHVLYTRMVRGWYTDGTRTVCGWKERGWYAEGNADGMRMACG